MQASPHHLLAQDIQMCASTAARSTHPLHTNEPCTCDACGCGSARSQRFARNLPSRLPTRPDMGRCLGHIHVRPQQTSIRDGCLFMHSGQDMLVALQALPSTLQTPSRQSVQATKCPGKASPDDVGPLQYHLATSNLQRYNNNRTR